MTKKSPITKAVVACAGWNTRFLPTVKAYAKQLVPVLDAPQILWVLEELVGAGISDICIVHRHGDPSLRNFFKPNSELTDYLTKTGKTACMDRYHQIMKQIKTLKFVPQGRSLPYGNGTPILATKNFFGDQPFVYLWGDDLTIEDKPGTFLATMINTFYKYQPDCINAVQKVARPEIKAYGAVKYLKHPQVPYQIESIIEKPEPAKAPSLLAQGARFIVHPKILKVLQQQEVERGELWFTNAVNTMAQTGICLAVPYTNATWIAAGDPKNWLKANIVLALKHPDFKDTIKPFLKTLT